MSHGNPPSEQAQAFLDEIAAIAAAYPGAFEEHPWGDTVYKVGKKVFVFLGASDEDYGLSVKLPRSAEAVLERPDASPTGYGLGRSGWVSIRFAADKEPPLDHVRAWIDESYRAIAPKKLIKTLP